VDLRLRLFLRLMERARPVDVLAQTPAQRAVIRERVLPPWLAAPILGAPARAVVTSDQIVVVPSGEMPVRVYRPRARPGLPTGKLPLVVNAHGGGWVQGNLQQNDWLCSHVADRVGAVVVSVDYRLAPDHPAPAAVDDCWAVLQGLLQHGEHAPVCDVDPRRVAVMGDSAGGNIAALLAIAHRDAMRAGGDGTPPAPLRHQVLIYPAVDMTLASPSIAARPNAPVLPASSIHGFRQLYLQGSGVADDDPRVSPLLATDHSDLAPALVMTTDLDPLEDDGVRYAEALRHAGVPVRYTCYADVPHGFMSLPGPAPLARQGLAEIVQELRTALV